MHKRQEIVGRASVKQMFDLQLWNSSMKPNTFLVNLDDFMTSSGKQWQTLNFFVAALKWSISAIIHRALVSAIN